MYLRQPAGAGYGDGGCPAGWPRTASRRLVCTGLWKVVAAGEPQLMTAEDLARQIKNPTLVCGELSAADRQVLARKRKNVILAIAGSIAAPPGFPGRTRLAALAGWGSG
jgi:hypothetical protein